VVVTADADCRNPDVAAMASSAGGVFRKTTMGCFHRLVVEANLGTIASVLRKSQDIR
jgi:hypothetical protein